MNSIKEKYKEPMVDRAIAVLEEYFPKGVSKERGAATIMLAKWIELVTEDLKIFDKKSMAQSDKSSLK